VGIDRPIALHAGSIIVRTQIAESDMNVSANRSGRKQRAEIDMRAFAKRAGATVKVPAGAIVFSQGEASDWMYIVQSGSIEMVIGDKIIETIGANEALGFMDGRRPAALLDRAGQGSLRTVADRRPDFPLHDR
jgi:hypothetical protein